MMFLGHFKDLGAHDDSTLYQKEEPPQAVSGNAMPGDRSLDFLANTASAGLAGIEVKNIREWIYPNREEVTELLLKCCSIDAVPVLIARRIHFSHNTGCGTPRRLAVGSNSRFNRVGAG